MSPEDPVKDDGVRAQAQHVKPTEGASSAPAASVDEVGDVPDPDEDDLDDLDDMLNDFNVGSKPAAAPSVTTGKQSSESTPRTEAKPDPSKPTANLENDFSEEDFAKQLQAGMADLLGELEKSPDMQAQFEDVFKQMSAATGESATAPAESAAADKSSKPEEPTAADASFQETIRRTMERMQNSGEQATAAAASGSEDDFMAEMLKQLSSGAVGGEGGEEDFSKMLMGMMEQLTNKEILYEPMKELHDKFPDWLDKNRATTSKEDLDRYELQQGIVAEIVTKFEDKSYKDSNPADREYIVDRMQKMQAAGSPPPDLVGDMSSAQDAFNMPDDQCNPQ
ncbi:Peroxisome biogenesis protein 19-like protein [Emericellopsis cladophorae]|uniref:Peroxisome biogenesis protein 19-like protein n=1 Tax=Emericellopsis cladophorae TaxID=2686198 RepID=A0A9P9Y196_9HYPO|nr:Peroxisome biogenesis protein 19-like protein [Emericellopsis cladophorae]KAI6781689.1 Peroxisome biogenesis protein 19-like protein [Emericellopsis cladophorae]